MLSITGLGWDPGLKGEALRFSLEQREKQELEAAGSRGQTSDQEMVSTEQVWLQGRKVARTSTKGWWCKIKEDGWCGWKCPEAYSNLIEGNNMGGKL